jgi:hypothetical protein
VSLLRFRAPLQKVKAKKRRRYFLDYTFYLIWVLGGGMVNNVVVEIEIHKSRTEHCRKLNLRMNFFCKGNIVWTKEIYSNAPIKVDIINKTEFL